MNDYQDKTKLQLVEEIKSLKNRIEELEQSELKYKQAEKTIKTNEIKLRNIIEHSSNLFYSHTPDHLITYLSPQTREFFDCEPEEAKIRWTDFLTENPCNEIGIVSTGKAIETGKIQPSYELEAVGKKGRKLWIEVNEAPVVEGGQTIAVVGALTDITERKRAEKELQDSEQRYSSFVKSFHGIAFRGDMNFTPLYFHGSVKEITGYTQEDFVSGKPRWDEIIHQDDLKRIYNAAEKIRTVPNFSDEREYRIIHKNGKTRWVQENIKNVCDDTGKPIFNHGAIYDITERKHSEEALKESEEKYRELFEAESDALFLIENETGNIIESNVAAEKLYGYTKNELAKKKNTDLSAESGKTQNVTEQTSLNKEDVVFIPVRYHKKKDGTVFPVEITGRFFNSKGKSVHVAAIRDITERKQSEEQLRESKYLLEQVLNTNPAIIFVKDKDSRILLANKTMADFYNLSIENVTGLLQSDLHQQYSPEQQEIEKWLADDREVIETGQSKNLEESGTDSNKLQHWFQTGKYPVDLSQDQKGVLVISEDITERKKVEAALQESEEKFRRLAENAPDIIYRFRVSPDPGFEFISPAVTEIVGYTPQEYYDDPELGPKVIHPDDRSKLIGLYRGIIPEGPHIVRWIRKDGKIIWTEDRAIPIYNEKGEFVAVEGIAREITAQKEAEEALKEAYDIINKSPAIPFLWKNEEGWPVEYVSENVVDLFEYTAEEFMSGKINYSKLIYPEDLERVGNEVTRYSSEEGTDRFSHEPYRIITKSGKVKWIEDKTYVRRDENNKITHYQGIVEDITTRRLSELARLESEEKFSKTFNFSPIPMIITEIESGKIVDVNNTFEKLIMYSKQEILGNNVFDLNLWANIEERENYIKKMKEEKRVSNFEMEIRTSSGDIRDSLISGEILTIQGKTYLLTSGIDITERKITQDALEEQLYLNQQILETTLDGYILADSDGKIIDVNPAYCDMIGYTWEELLKMNIREVEVKIPPEEVDRRIKQMIRTGGDQFETKHKHKDGHILELDTSTSVTYLDEAPRVAAFMRDITDRKLAEEARRESEERFSRLSEAAFEGIGISDGVKIIEANDQLAKILGYKPNEIIGKNAMEFVAPESRELVMNNIKSGTEGSYEHYALKNDGSIFPVEVQAKTLPYEGRSFRVTAIRDITERKKAEEEIRKLSHSVEQSPATVIITDTSGNIEYVNPKFEEITGYNANEVIGKNPSILKSGKTTPEEYEILWQTIKSGGEWHGEFHNKKKNGELYWELASITAIKDSNGQNTHYIAIKEDITRHKAMDKRLRESHNRLRSFAERLQMIREEERATIAREIHDDLGQSLTALKMDISWVKNNPEIDAEAKTAIFEKMLDLTNSTIQTVKRIATELRPGILDDLGLVPAIEWQAAEFQNRFKIKCNVSINKSDIIIKDEISIAVFRIFQETLTNVARHSGATKVDVNLIFYDDNKLIIDIADNGVGIEQEQINSSKSLGLFGMRERVNILNGKMEIIGEPGKGTKVRVSIPILKEDAGNNI
jgi:PAS domain S-box-containing protein